jgi:hypothetical protein
MTERREWKRRETDKALGLYLILTYIINCITIVRIFFFLIFSFILIYTNTPERAQDILE